jgi:hypothetical protein
VMIGMTETYKKAWRLKNCRKLTKSSWGNTHIRTGYPL